MRRAITDLRGATPTWPRPVDASLEWWAARSGRARVALRAAAAVVVVLASTGGLLRGPWGPSVEVLVATEDLAAGSPVTTAAVEVADRPQDLVPAGALRAAADLPGDAIATSAVPAGAILTPLAVSGGGPAAAAAPGTAVVPVTAEQLPPLPIGTRVDVAVVGAVGEAAVVARDAALVADDGTWRWLRVDRGDVAAVARGISDGTLTVAVLPARRDGSP